jgi:hypothetical protein
MKKAGAILLILLMVYNTSFSFCYNALVVKSLPAFKNMDRELLVFDISNDSLIQPFMMDSEFSNLGANRSFIENDINPIVGLRFISMLSINSVLLSATITPVQTESILTAKKYFIPSYRLINLLGNHFAFRA